MNIDYLIALRRCGIELILGATGLIEIKIFKVRIEVTDRAKIAVHSHICYVDGNILGKTNVEYVKAEIFCVIRSVIIALKGSCSASLKVKHRNVPLSVLNYVKSKEICGGGT